ncbi:multidrug ABC transporter ATP-binding protein [Haladaptatus sp. R4]|uniref:ABC transporter ATP-binding protein n=1 Tax=Haladaptatus sp. R4 TaxID=1679489 RepID=UPI0007B4C22B|nr:ABC transporter ATP-binding protein [Haladaptatus sp. R4]KZN24840.1 multidrug ABC transporter ATP-binding protein [Haladaptatus sp. R4]
MNAIETDGLTKRYGTTTAVKDLELRVPEGEIYGFLGPNGSGKTTTTRMLTTLTEPTRGTARIDGHPLDAGSDLSSSIGYLPERPPVYEEFTGYEQLEYASGLHDAPDWKRDRRLGDLIDRFEITADLGDRISTYSKGMKQKIGLVQSLMHDPAVLFLDEPFSGLDPRSSKVLEEFVVEFAESGRTVFLSTHVLPIIEAVATLVGILYDGVLIAEGSPEALKHRMGTDGGTDLEAVFLELTDERTIL